MTTTQSEITLGASVTYNPNKFWLRFGRVIEISKGASGNVLRVRVEWSHEIYNGSTPAERKVGIRTWVQPSRLTIA